MMKIARFFVPPPVSPSARPALGVALAMNVLLAGGAHVGLAFAASTQVSDKLTLDVVHAAPVIYLALLLPVVAIYGMAAAAWTGWSWWRVPVATLAAATLALGANAWGMAQWIAKQGWTVNMLLSAADPRVEDLCFLAGISAFVLIAIALSMWYRWCPPE